MTTVLPARSNRSARARPIPDAPPVTRTVFESNSIAASDDNAGRGARTMTRKDPRIDAYIAKSAKFARPILKHLRALVHEGCPDVVETVKWSMPHFDYNGVLCGMAAFKEHCAFGFWNRALKIPGQGGAMGQFGCIKSLSDLPSDKVLVGYVREAARLNATGEKVGPIRRERKPLPVPPEL